MGPTGGASAPGGNQGDPEGSLRDLPDGTPEVATCGQGASCAGQCSALKASLCPSGNCTDDPRTCEISFKTEATEDQRRSQLGFAQARNNHEHSDVTLSALLSYYLAEIMDKKCRHPIEKVCKLFLEGESKYYILYIEYFILHIILHFTY